MEKTTALTMDHFLFSGETIGEVSILTFKRMPLLHVTDLDAKAALFDYLELISNHDDIKALVIKSAPVKMERTEYINYYKKLIASNDDPRPLERMYNAINQFILQLADIEKMVIHVDSGNVILLFMNISLACDYRIVADNTVFQNPNIDLNVVPKGGSVFYLSKMLGTLTASKLLLSRED
ncbi:MAG: enoyl-CoA hydratase/isomerase family protein, partial [Proteobacteria bacterium]|nr:enoyl-CoA hydratase/isomerase family protein [Pseudomonadota bacterium]